MGAWGHGLFANDGAEDVFAQLAERGKGEQWPVLLAAFGQFDEFLARDARGETFRPITDAERAEDDALVRDALADLPHLLEGFDDDDETDGDDLVDTGDHEVQMMVAAAGLIAAVRGAEIKLPKQAKAFGVPDAPDDAAAQARKRLDAFLQHDRLLAQFTKAWRRSVTELRDVLGG